MADRQYDPWRDLRLRFPDVCVVTHHRLPDGQLGGLADRRIWLDRDLDEAGRRSTLAHEIVHLERIGAGGSPIGPWAADGPRGKWMQLCDRREERIVDSIAARRLIELRRLVCALRWSRNVGEIATELSVDAAMVNARIAGLTDEERGMVDRRLGYSGRFHD